MLSLGYVLGFFFFVASSLGVSIWILAQHGIRMGFFAHISSWLFLIGTLGFSEMAYEVVRDAYAAKERARELLSECINFAQYYNRDSELWKEYKENNSLDSLALNKLLEYSDVLLSESEIDNLLQEIDVNGDGTITKDEFELYLQAEKSNRQLVILGECLQNFDFVSNTSWFIGAVGYCGNIYSTGLTQAICKLVRFVASFLLFLVLPGLSHAFPLS